MAHNPSQNVRKQGQAERPYKDRSNGLVRKAIDQRLPPMASGGPLPTNQAQSAGGPQLGSQTSLSNAPRPLGGYGSPTHAGTPQGLGGATRLPQLRNPGVGQRERDMVSNAGVNSQLGAMGGGMSNQPRPDIKQGVPGSRGAGVAGMVRNSTDQNTRSAYQTANPQFDRNGLVYGATNIGGGTTGVPRPDWAPGPRGPDDFRPGSFGQLGSMDQPQDQLRGELQRGKESSRQIERIPDKGTSAYFAYLARQQGNQIQSSVNQAKNVYNDSQSQAPAYNPDDIGTNRQPDAPPAPQTGTGGPTTATPIEQPGQQQQARSDGLVQQPDGTLYDPKTGDYYSENADKSLQQIAPPPGAHGGVGAGGTQGLTAEGGQGAKDAPPQQESPQQEGFQPPAGYGEDKQPVGGYRPDSDTPRIASDLGTDQGFVEYLIDNGYTFFRDESGNLQWLHPSESNFVLDGAQDAGDFQDEITGGDEVHYMKRKYEEDRKKREAEQGALDAQNERIAANQRIWDELGKAEQMDMSSLAGSYDRMKTAMEAQYKKQRAESQEAMSARASRGNLPSGAAMAAQTMGSNQFDIANAQQRGALDIDHETKVVQAKMRDADRRYQTAMMMAAQAMTREERAEAEAYAREAQQEMREWENYVYERDKPGALEMILGIGSAVAGPVAGALTGGIGSAIGGAGGAAAGAVRGQSPNEAELARLAMQKKQQGYGNQGNTGPAY